MEYREGFPTSGTELKVTYIMLWKVILFFIHLPYRLYLTRDRFPSEHFFQFVLTFSRRSHSLVNCHRHR